jgi:hypothetical protein
MRLDAILRKAAREFSIQPGASFAAEKSKARKLVACRSEFVTEFGCPTLAASLFLPLGWEAAALVRYLCDSPLGVSAASSDSTFRFTVFTSHREF